MLLPLHLPLVHLLVHHHVGPLHEPAVANRTFVRLIVDLAVVVVERGVVGEVLVADFTMNHYHRFVRRQVYPLVQLCSFGELVESLAN